jgi:hypothetical protein
MDNTSKRRNDYHVLYILARGFVALPEIPPLRKIRRSDFPLLRTFWIFTVESLSPRTFPDRIHPASFHFQGIRAFLAEVDSGGSDSIGVRTEPSGRGPDPDHDGLPFCRSATKEGEALNHV